MRSNLSILFFFFCFSSFAQTLLTGKVFSGNNIPIEYFTAKLLSPTDSTVILLGTFSNGSFKFDKVKEQKYILKISSLGFADYLQSIEVKKYVNDSLSPIILIETSLNEVTISARRPTIISKADRTIIKVEGCFLSKTLNGLDMLLKTPGLTKDILGEISVAGIGKPIFYIDGKQTHSIEEIKILNPQNIKSIEIIDNPSSTFDADGHAVVLIHTIKRTDHYSIVLGGDFTQSRVSSSSYYADGVLNVGNVSTTLYYGFNNSINKSHEENFSNLYSLGTMSEYKTSIYAIKEHSYRLSSEFTLSKKHSLEFLINGYFSTQQNSHDKSIEFSNVALSSFKTYSTSNGKPTQLNATLNYNFKIDTLGQTLKVFADIYNRYKNSYQSFYNVLEGNEDKKPFLNENDNTNTSSIYSLKTDYVKPLHNILTFESGLKYYNIFSQTQTNLSGSTNLIQQNSTIEKNYAAYISLTANLNKKIELKAGLRLENMVRNAKDEGVLYLDTTQLNIFPSSSINYRFSDNLSIGLSYSERISRPPLQYMDPSLIVDSILNRKGNPTLKSTLIHSFQLSVKLFNSLSIRGGYRYLINPFYFYVYKDEVKPQVTDVRIINGTDTYSFYGNIGYNKDIFKWWSISVYGSIRTNNYPYYENEILKNNNTPLPYFSIENTLNLPYNITFDVGCTYSGKGSYDAIFNESYSNIFGSLQKDFFNKLMTCTLSFNDLLHSSITHQHSVLNGNNLNVFDDDAQYVNLTLIYRFGSSKYRYKSKSGNDEEFQRIK